MGLERQLIQLAGAPSFCFSAATIRQMLAANSAHACKLL